MEVKKTAKADLEKKKGLFIEIGLCVSLLVVILLFGWSQKERVVEMMDTQVTVIEEEMVDITIQEEKPKPQQARTIQQTTDVIDIVKNDTKISTDYDFSADFSDEPIEIKAAAPKEEEVVAEDVPILKAEVMPTFQGGDLTVFRNWVMDQLVYPAAARDNNVQGTVTLSFVVDRLGNVANIEVLSSPDRSLEQEAIRVVKSSPQWKPGSQRGRPQAVKLILPIKFELL